MMRLTIAAATLALLACSNKPKTTTGGGEKIPPKRVIISWGFQAEGETSEVFLATTDETGKQVSHPIGRYKGKCDKITPAKEMSALTGAACTTEGGGTELHAVVKGNEIIVVRMTTTTGATPDPMARETVTSIAFPLGAAVDVAP